MSTNNTTPTTCIKALHELIRGNARYVTSKLIHPRQTADHRSEVSSGQSPFAIILGCADYAYLEVAFRSKVKVRKR